MGELEKQDSGPLTEDLQFLTACLIDHRIKVQTNSFLLSGTLIAANFDKDYGLIINVGGKDVQHGKIKIFLKDIIYISAENVFLDLNKDAMLASCRSESRTKVVPCISQSSAGQLVENMQAAEQDAVRLVSRGTNTVSVPDQKQCTSGQDMQTAQQQASYTYPPSTVTQPTMQIIQPVAVPVPYQLPNSYDVQWTHLNTGEQFVTYMQQPLAAPQPMQGYAPRFDPQMQTYIYYPQYQWRSENFAPSNQAPRRS